MTFLVLALLGYIAWMVNPIRHSRSWYTQRKSLAELLKVKALGLLFLKIQVANAQGSHELSVWPLVGIPIDLPNVNFDTLWIKDFLFEKLG